MKKRFSNVTRCQTNKSVPSTVLLLWLIAQADSWGAGYNYASSGPIGNKTECALLSFVSVLGPATPGYVELRRRTPETSFVKVYTFNSQRKWMATVVPSAGQPRVAHDSFDDENEYRIYVKGAAEMVVSRSASKKTLHVSGDFTAMRPNVVKLMRAM
jgi:magnesium-transporting ATPase (P-type)